MSAAAMANVPALRRKGSAKAIPISTLPRGGPANWFITISAPQSRAFAFSNPLGSTIAGRIVWAELSYNTSANPNSNAETNNTRYTVMFVPAVTPDTTSPGDGRTS